MSIAIKPLDAEITVRMCRGANTAQTAAIFGVRSVEVVQSVQTVIMALRDKAVVDGVAQKSDYRSKGFAEGLLRKEGFADWLNAQLDDVVGGSGEARGTGSGRLGIGGERL